MSLPLPWVERIFTKLNLIYGREFSLRWEGLSMADVKTNWAHELACFEGSPEAIGHAIETLPSMKPPTVLEFKRLCLTCPSRATVALPAPKQDPVFVSRLVSEMKKPGEKHDGKEWARRLQRRHLHADRLNAYQIFCYQQALKN